jgi:hypothetical protein
MKKNFLIFLLFLAMALMLDFSNQHIIFPFALLSIALLNISVYRLFLRWKFLLFLAILVLAVPLFIGEKDAVFMGISYATGIFRSSVVMAERSIILLMGLNHFTSRISVDQMARVMANSRFKNFSQVFSLSMKALPDVKSITTETFHEYRRVSDGRNFLPNFYHYSIKLMVRILHYAGNISEPDIVKDYSDE